MEILGIIVLIVGGLAMLVGSIMFLVAAFSESVLWGLGCIVIPFVSLFFLIMHWQEAKKAFLVHLAGFALLVVGMLIGGGPSMLHHH